MRIFHSISDFKPLAPPVVTIGSFDGVHLGHTKLISRIVEQSRIMEGESVILTFFPHPKMVLHPEEHGVELLSTTLEKIALLEQSGIDTLIIQPFSRDFSEMAAEDFIRDIIVGALKTRHLVIGYDHRFGNRRSGGIAELKSVGKTLGFEVEEIPEQDIDAIAVSSSRIRLALKSASIQAANNLLGRSYSLAGLVVRGERLGTAMGFPTANIQVKESYKLIPAEGVYIAYAEVSGKLRPAMLSIGSRPTVSNSGKVSVEVHILDFNDDLYGSPVTVHFLDHLRENVKFESLDALKAQLNSDLETTRNFFRSNSERS